MDHRWKDTDDVPLIECEACGLWRSRSTPDPLPACPGPVKIAVRFDGDYLIRPGDVWPDGDFPPKITAEAVKVAMETLGPRSAALLEYGMTAAVHVAVGDTEQRVWE